MTDACAGCGTTLPEGSRACGSCGNNPKRKIRIAGAAVLLVGVPVFFVQPPIGIILWAMGLFLFVGAWYVSASTHEF